MIFEYAPDVAFNLIYDNQFFEMGGVKKAKKRPGKKNRASFDRIDKQRLIVSFTGNHERIACGNINDLTDEVGKRYRIFLFLFGFFTGNKGEQGNKRTEHQDKSQSAFHNRNHPFVGSVLIIAYPGNLSTIFLKETERIYIFFRTS